MGHVDPHDPSGGAPSLKNGAVEGGRVRFDDEKLIGNAFVMMGLARLCSGFQPEYAGFCHASASRAYSFLLPTNAEKFLEQISKTFKIRWSISVTKIS